MVGLVLLVPSAHAQLQYVGSIGSSGSADGLFNQPYGTAVDSSGNIYIADTSNHRIQKFSSAGAFVFKFGTLGNSTTQFNSPYSLALDSSNNIYVADRNNNRVMKYSNSGSFIIQFGSTGFDIDNFGGPITDGSNNGELSLPSGVTVDGSNNVYIVDAGNNRVQKFNSAGSFVFKFGTVGSGDGQFNNPFGIALDSTGNIYVTDSGNHRVQKFSASGAFLGKFGSSGNGDGQFNTPTGIALDSVGNIYVTDTLGHRLQKFNSSGVFMSKFGSNGSGNGQFNTPRGIAVDSTGSLFVADTLNHRIQKINVNNPVPTLTEIDPGQLLVNSGDVTITVTGANFFPDSKVKFVSNKLDTTYVSPTELTAVIPAIKLAKGAGNARITVFNPTPGGGVSNPVNLVISNPVPTLTSIAPTQAIIGDTDTTVILTGTNFLPISRAQFGGNSLSATYVSPTELRVVISTKRLATAGVTPITVYNPSPGGTSAGIDFTVVSPVPTLATVSPNSVFETSPLTTITVTGSNFVPASRVYLGTRLLTTTYISGTQLTALVPSSQLITLGNYSVTVSNPSPSGVSNPSTFSVIVGPSDLGIVGVPTVTKSGSNLVVRVTFMTTGSYPAHDVQISAAQLGVTNSSAISPATVFTLNAGATKVITLTFPMSAAASGSTPTVNVTYTSTNGGSGTASATTATVP